MDNRTDVREFLVSRRAKVTPERAGLPAFGGHRRVPGLRREEVALLAGVSVDYYTRMERGDLTGVSDQVLEAVAGALQLDEPERAHLRDLARDRAAVRRARRRPATQVRSGVQQILDAITGAPAYVRNARRDVLAANRLGRALYSPLFDDHLLTGTAGTPPNVARFVFLSPRARAYFVDWDRAASDTVATLRTEAGLHPLDRDLSDLIGELITRSAEFTALWAAHNVRFHRTGSKSVHHPVVGTLHLAFEAMELPADPGLSLVVYSAEPDTPTADGLVLLASWAATLNATPADAGAEDAVDLS